MYTYIVTVAAAASTSCESHTRDSVWKGEYAGKLVAILACRFESRLHIIPNQEIVAGQLHATSMIATFRLLACFCMLIVSSVICILGVS